MHSWTAGTMHLHFDSADNGRTPQSTAEKRKEGLLKLPKRFVIFNSNITTKPKQAMAYLALKVYGVSDTQSKQTVAFLMPYCLIQRCQHTLHTSGYKVQDKIRCNLSEFCDGLKHGDTIHRDIEQRPTDSSCKTWLDSTAAYSVLVPRLKSHTQICVAQGILMTVHHSRRVQREHPVTQCWCCLHQRCSAMMHETGLLSRKRQPI